MPPRGEDSFASPLTRQKSVLQAIYLQLFITISGSNTLDGKATGEAPSRRWRFEAFEFPIPGQLERQLAEIMALLKR